MHFLWEAIIGLIVGAIAKLVMPGKDPGGVWITMALGVAGSLLAGFLGRAVGWYAPGQSAGFIMSIIGALILLGIYRLVKGKPAATTS
ncbi:MAG: GlsB/YeaQ/YmgE family stress response membrane protein [Acidobacteria bacterium]|nr:MAG: GlsB/YeaQ/YmgE family stress response membrane protein [Acidobacteriota bacterium]